jgi:sulfoxide reductase catalytic subunit YedY
MLIRKAGDLRYSDVTPKQMYVNRRRFLTSSLTLGAFGALSETAQAGKLSDVKKTAYDAGGEKLTPLEAITHYNNFYEFGTDKGDPSENAKDFRTRPGC